MRILIITTQVPFVSGGAETQANSLQKALREHGHEVEIAQIPFKWYPPERIHDHVLATRLLDLTESNGVPVDLLIGLKFPAYHVRHPNKVLWIIHQHRTAFEMWQSEHCDLSPYPAGKSVRDSIESIERSFIPEARKVFSECRNVGDRLKKYCGIDSVPLYHPPQDPGGFYSKEAEPFIYFPSRLNRWKRQHLAIEAYAQSKQQGKLLLSGAPDHPDYEANLRGLIRKWNLQDKVELMGKIPFPEMLELYARCTAVLFPPDNEDYGYITLEAMLSAKPVITTTDSGGPTEFVVDGQTGLILEPEPRALASAMDEAFLSPAFSREFGLAGRQRYENLEISWDSVVQALTH